MLTGGNGDPHMSSSRSTTGTHDRSTGLNFKTRSGPDRVSGSQACLSETSVDRKQRCLRAPMGERTGAGGGGSFEAGGDGRGKGGIRLWADHLPARRSCWLRMLFNDLRRRRCPGTSKILGHGFAASFSASTECTSLPGKMNSNGLFQLKKLFEVHIVRLMLLTVQANALWNFGFGKDGGRSVAKSRIKDDSINKLDLSKA
ncbi:hypothetical protein C4D60_Mb10t23760 [Musa balbisiana]|uniref:Uncharacterized protein n=1 Tax=Musa balbisiana TaxID=52838 RepID=A0A4S8IZD7_MUSBA|nr:hypothetical protein C4D60_Mb10t23760 [Musa balbisiana]